MPIISGRKTDKFAAIHRTEREVVIPKDKNGKFLKVSEYFGENVFDFRTADGIPESVKTEMIEAHRLGKKVAKEHIELIANLVTEWATSKGATHFCHWFHPLTGNSAEKHDSFLSYTRNNRPIERLSVTQLMQGEPDASSFPHGGARSTFEARGYTIWDMSSPMFIKEGKNGKILCIPTAFVSFYGEALDIKTPLLRSISKIDKAATRFLHLVGRKNTKRVMVTCGAEQEYFLIDKSFYYARPDLVMTGRTLFGSPTTRNQQLEDHYFGSVPERVLSFMQELDYELYRLGIPSKTRHNEVAPGQFEVAPRFQEANLSADQNQLVMELVKKMAKKHNFEALLHEKPFSGINGSGKHLNWSLCDENGFNLLEPGDDPHQNHCFLAMVAIIVEALYRHSDMLRMSVASHGNDHRLGANEAPPSIISVFLGGTLNKIYDSILSDANFMPSGDQSIDLRAEQLVHLLVDNTDRNRTSPFAFTGNRFEFRAVGSSHAIGFPLSILNAAVAEVIEESNQLLESELSNGIDLNDALLNLIRRWMGNSRSIVFNGDGYSGDWVKEAQKRGLSNLKNSAEALTVLTDEKAIAFLVDSGIYTQEELKTRYNVQVKRYNQHREIEFQSLITMINQYVLPAGMDFKRQLLEILQQQKDLTIDSSSELEVYKKTSELVDTIYEKNKELKKSLEGLSESKEQRSFDIANNLLPLSEEIAQLCHRLEEVIPDHLWTLPKYYDMLFLH